MKVAQRECGRCRTRRNGRRAGLLLCLAALTLAGCSGSGKQARATTGGAHDVTLTRAQRKSIHTVTVQPATYAPRITALGTVDFDHDQATPVSAPFSGAVTRLLVDLGSHVQRGQALARVDSPDFANAVGAYRKALLNARNADAIAAHDRDMLAHKAISERENAQAQADAASADADRDAARQTLQALHVDAKTIAAIRAGRAVAKRQGVIRAPIAGTVVERGIAPGQSIQADATHCFTIADTSKMWVMAQVFGRDVGRIHAGDTARIDVDDGGKPVSGTVTHVGSVVQADTRSVKVRVRADNPHGRLRKGMYVDVQLQSRKHAKGILLPVSAILRNDENLPFVYVVEADGGYARTRVTLGPRIGDRVVIPKGLAAGDKVVVDGSIFLRFIQTQ